MSDMEQSVEVTGSRKLRVFVCGAQSTGKSTLVDDVCRHHSSNSLTPVHEVARQLIKDLDILSWVDYENHPLRFEKLQLLILCEQNHVERQYSDTDYITDRGIDPLVYARSYLGEAAYQRLLSTAPAQDSITRYRQDNCLVFVVKPQRACVKEDGFRLTPDWSKMCHFHDAMINVLQSLGIRYDVIDTADRDERVQVVLRKIAQAKENLAQET